MQLENITPIILAGGRGRRLRPLTSYRNPKPFLKLRPPYNLLQDTLIRCAGMARPIIVCQKIYLPKVQRALRDVARYDITPRAIIAEPYERSTAPAIAAAALAMAPYMTFAVMPCDHVVEQDGSLMAAIEAGAEQVNETGGFVSVGVRPRNATRRFGYMHKGPVIEGSHIYESDRFIEKPPADYVRELYKSGQYVWNTGVFVGRVFDYLREFQLVEAEYLDLVKDSFEKSLKYDLIYELNREFYHKLPHIPVDNAILERCSQRYVAMHHGFWDDAGTLPAFFRLWLRRFWGILRP